MSFSGEHKFNEIDSSSRRLMEIYAVVQRLTSIWSKVYKRYG